MKSEKKGCCEGVRAFLCAPFDKLEVILNEWYLESLGDTIFFVHLSLIRVYYSIKYISCTGCIASGNIETNQSSARQSNVVVSTICETTRLSSKILVVDLEQ